MLAAAEIAASRQRIWRWALLGFLLVPLIPSIVLFAIGALGKSAGCEPAVPCKVAGIWLGNTAVRALDLATAFAVLFIMLGAVWLVLCLYPIHHSFARNRWRMIAAFFAACWLTLAPVMMALAAASFASHGRCQFNEGGVVNCTIYGVTARAGNDLGAAFWGILIGYPLCALVLIGYLMFLFIRWRRERAVSATTS